MHTCDSCRFKFVALILNLCCTVHSTRRSTTLADCWYQDYFPSCITLFRLFEEQAKLPWGNYTFGAGTGSEMT